MNHYLDVGVGLDRLQQQSCPASGITPLEECASNILIGDCVNIENIRTLLDHPEARWTSNGDGFQITLGAARLLLKLQIRFQISPESLMPTCSSATTRHKVRQL